MHNFITERLLIRPLAAQDKVLFIKLYTDVKVMRNISPPLSHKKAEKAFHNTLKIMKKSQPSVMIWVIVNLADEKTIGIQGFTWPSMKSEHLNSGKYTTAEIGIMLLRNSNGKLIPEEATTALIEYAFNHLPIERINTFYAKDNFSVAKLAQKLGFIFNKCKQPLDGKQCLQYIDKRNWGETASTKL